MKSLIERNQYIEAILEHVTTGIITLNEHATLMTMNKAACDLFQIRAEGYLGLSLRVALGGSYAPLIDEMGNISKYWYRLCRSILLWNISKITAAIPAMLFMTILIPYMAV